MNYETNVNKKCQSQKTNADRRHGRRVSTNKYIVEGVQ